MKTLETQKAELLDGHIRLLNSLEERDLTAMDVVLLHNYNVIISAPKEPCKHLNVRSGHSPFVACICNDCNEEV